MARLEDTFRTPEARVWRTILAVDLSESTRMKEEQGEASWLNTYGWFFDMLAEVTESYGGVIVKYHGDGAMVVFGEEQATEAINAAIKIQEMMADARARNMVKCSCSTAIASGTLIEFDLPIGAKDYIGTVVDRAFRLGVSANANAIFVDTDTVAAASMTKVVSAVGTSTAVRRTASEYQGKEESLRLKGFSSPVAYHEILWENSRFSIKPPFASELSTTPSRAPAPSITSRGAQKAAWARGTVKTLGPRFGWIEGPEEEVFWFNNDYLFSADHPVVSGREVWFVPLPAIEEGKNRRASVIIPFGATLSGELIGVFPEGYGFAACGSDSTGTFSIFVNLGDASSWAKGDVVTFDVGENPKGIAGFNPRKQ